MSIYNVDNLGTKLANSAYPGRGIVVGKSPNGKSAVFAYFIMGRSANSRNRIFTETEDGIRTEPYDASKVEDPSLIIYAPVRHIGKSIVVTNGDQTDTVVEHMAKGESFVNALRTRCFEPDGPNWTPRISAILNFANGFDYEMSILKSADAEGTACNRYLYSYEPLAGVGHFIHTYGEDGNPLPTFTGEPERVATCDDIDCFTDMIWNNLNADNKISLYVTYVDLETGAETHRLINKYN
ncbi:MAG: IMP cyclohydrolase [Clostridia bacterium]|nr:IMP cyclohydrolase [Clostridia bacterium]